MKNEYILSEKVGWDKYVVIVTVVFTILFVYVGYELVLYYQENQDILSLFSLIVLPVIILACIATLPVSIQLTSDKLVITQLCGKKVISRNDILEVRPYHADKTDIRLIGTGGYFGTRGKYRNATVGIYYSYVCHSEEAFLVKTKTNTYVFSCRHSELIINSLKERV